MVSPNNESMYSTMTAVHGPNEDETVQNKQKQRLININSKTVRKNLYCKLLYWKEK